MPPLDPSNWLQYVQDHQGHDEISKIYPKNK
jgi:hypothetical protein